MSVSSDLSYRPVSHRPTDCDWLQGSLETRDGRHWPRHELAARVDQLAGQLLAINLQQHELVAVCMLRDEQWACLLLALFRIGVPWLSLDPDHPPSRLAQRLNSTGIVCTLVDDVGARSLRPAGCEYIRVDELSTGRGSHVTPAVAAQPSPDRLAYVIHTSGSTGTPHAVEITRAALLSRLQSLQQTLPLQPSDRLLQHSAVSFDVSIEEVFWPIYAGATLVMGQPRQHAPTILRHSLDAARITVLDVVPAVLQRLLAVQPTAPKTLRLLLCGGETLSSDLLQTCRRQWPSCQLVNVYGPAEATINASYWLAHDLDAGMTPPIGRPFPGTTLLVLDDQQRLVRMGDIGELYIGGDGLARGYRHEPALTEQRFVMVPGRGRLYRTGDRVRQLPDLNYEFVGRRDSQIKLRGQRIEPGEIEFWLNQCDAVQQAAVLLDDSRTSQLVACILPRAGQDTDLLRQQLNEHLRQHLPLFMVPQRWMLLDTLPITANGKIDRQALRALISRATQDRHATMHVDAADVLAQQYAQCMASVLSLGELDIDSSFFDAGGDSLSAYELMLQLQQKLNQSITLDLLYQHPTPRQLASAQQTQRHIRESSLVTLRRATTDENTLHLFCLPPGDGGTSVYLPLAQALPSHISVHALPVWSIDAEYPWPEHLDDMVNHCLQAIRQIPNEGPLHLLGWSMGAVLAHEVARRWSDDGGEVGSVLLLDPASPWRDHDNHVHDDVFAWRVTSAMWQLPLAIDTEPFQQADDHARAVMLQSGARARGLALAALEPTQVLQMVRNLGHLHRGLEAFCPPTTQHRLPLSLLLPQCRAHDEYAPQFWSALSPASITVEAGVDHLSMMQRDYAAELALRVRAAIDGTLGDEFPRCDLQVGSQAKVQLLAVTDHTSVLPGQTLRIAISAGQPGHYAFWIGPADDPTLTLPISVSVPHQPLPTSAGWLGVDWQTTLTLRIPERWRPGLYRLCDTHWNMLAYFVVRPLRSGEFSKTVLHAPFFTAQAYSAVGGKSLYDYNSTHGRSKIVGLQRPDAHPWSAQHFLEAIGSEYPVEVCASMDLHQQPNLLEAYDCLILVGHDEYWSASMHAQIRRFVRNGGNVLVLSGNTGYRQVRIEAHGQMVFAGHAFDDDATNLDKTTAFDDEVLALPVNDFLGAGWRHGAAGGDATHPDAYQIHHPDHWVFAGITTPPPAFMHYETDAAAFVLDEQGIPLVTGEDGTPLTCTILASAQLAHWRDKPGLATMTLLERGGTVFHAGSTEWVTHLQDPWIRQITCNVLQRLAKRTHGDHAERHWQQLPALHPARHWLSDAQPLQTHSNDLTLRLNHEGVLCWCWMPAIRSAPARTNDHADTERTWTALPIRPLMDAVAITANSQYVYAITRQGTLWVSNGLFITESTDWIELETSALPEVQQLVTQIGLLYARTPTGLWSLNCSFLRRRTP